MIDITALGEVLIDFTSVGISPQGNILFERNPGGAPANVAVCVSRLGGKSAFIGKVGRDMFGTYLAEVLESNGVITSGIRFSDAANTTLAFVQLDEKGDRSFSFYRNPGADTALEAGEIDYRLIKSSRVFHFGSLSLTDEPSRSATIAALEFAKKSGCTVSYDPNLRPALWRSMEEARERIRAVMGLADILKISGEELEFITGSTDLEAATASIYSQFGVGLILVTRGAKGSFYRFKDFTGAREGFKSVCAVDTTGAGDAFFGGFLYGMLSRGISNIEHLDKNTIRDITGFANATAAICVTKKGAIPALPDYGSVTELLKSEEL